MRALSSSDFLGVWEQGLNLHPLDQGLLALSVALPEVAPESLADWPLGRRNRSLFGLHCSCFGSRLLGWISCACCGEKMEFEMDSRGLMTQTRDGTCDDPVAVRGQSFRLPTSRDLAIVVHEAKAGAPAAAIRVLERCCLANDNSFAWSEDDIKEIEETLASADPSPWLETRLALRCPACGHESGEILDIATFVWGEIASCAKRLLWEVHALASAYGWTEAQNSFFERCTSRSLPGRWCRRERLSPATGFDSDGFDAIRPPLADAHVFRSRARR